MDNFYTTMKVVTKLYEVEQRWVSAGSIVQTNKQFSLQETGAEDLPFPKLSNGVVGKVQPRWMQYTTWSMTGPSNSKYVVQATTAEGQKGGWVVTYS